MFVHCSSKGTRLQREFHSLPKKLLVLISANTTEAKMIPQAHYLLNRFLEKGGPFQIVVLKGMGDAESLDVDINIIRIAAGKLGVSRKASNVQNLTIADYSPSQQRQLIVADAPIAQYGDPV